MDVLEMALLDDNLFVDHLEELELLPEKATKWKVRKIITYINMLEQERRDALTIARKYYDDDEVRSRAQELRERIADIILELDDEVQASGVLGG